MNQNPSGPWLIRKLHSDELDNAFALIWRVFKKFVAPDYTDEGITFFYKQFITGQDFRNNFLNLYERTLISLFITNSIKAPGGLLTCTGLSDRRIKTYECRAII